MTRTATRLSLVILVVAGGLQACRKKPEAAPEPVAAAPVSDAGAAQRRADSLAALAAAQRRADSLAAARSAATANEEGAQAALRRVLAQVVYFDFDKDNLRDDARAVLDAKAAVLAANGGIAVVVTGHTDEQGTSEYNLALGQRRAAQVKRYLESKGIAENRMTTQSMGDSQPAAQGSDEASYQLNRRAEFETRNASGALMRPRP
jgi:peptidoglycan-associated lipoprotein